MSEPYNPLSKINLARSIETEILTRPLRPLVDIDTFNGAGVYALFYGGSLPFYAPLAASLDMQKPIPIYVGKAIPKGGRIGGVGLGDVATTALSSRLKTHRRSIQAADDLEPGDFFARYMTLDDIWIPLGENILIETYTPVWNSVITGFGNNPPGAGRAAQKISLWDILHPGRAKISSTPQLVDRAVLRQRVVDYLAGKAVPMAPKDGSTGEDDEA